VATSAASPAPAFTSTIVITSTAAPAPISVTTFILVLIVPIVAVATAAPTFITVVIPIIAPIIAAATTTVTSGTVVIATATATTTATTTCAGRGQKVNDPGGHRCVPARREDQDVGSAAAVEEQIAEFSPPVPIRNLRRRSCKRSAARCHSGCNRHAAYCDVVSPGILDLHHGLTLEPDPDGAGGGWLPR
jgi:hypothetical protein